MSIELIAECSSNHGGDRGLMDAFIAHYADAGATFVKFQSYQVKTLRPGDPQRDWLAQAELSDDDHHFLIERCAHYGTQFLTTVFHASRVPFLASLGLPAIKIGSGEATCDELRAAVNNIMFPRVLVSTGMQPEWYPHAWWGNQAVFFRCASRYPHPSGFAASAFYRDPTLGYSDHSIGMEGAMLAITSGARIIEKHVSLPEQKRPVRPWETTVDQFKDLRAFADENPERHIGRWQATSIASDNA